MVKEVEAAKKPAPIVDRIDQGKERGAFSRYRANDSGRTLEDSVDSAVG